MAPTLQDQARAIWKLNNIIYSWLNQPRPNVVTNKYRHDSSYDWEYLAKNFDIISDDPIAENNLLKLNLYISALGYLEDRPSYFTKVIEDEDKDGEEQDNEPQVSDFEEKKKKKMTL